MTEPLDVGDALSALFLHTSVTYLYVIFKAPTQEPLYFTICDLACGIKAKTVIQMRLKSSKFNFKHFNVISTLLSQYQGYIFTVCSVIYKTRMIFALYCYYKVLQIRVIVTNCFIYLCPWHEIRLNFVIDTNVYFVSFNTNL